MKTILVLLFGLMPSAAFSDSSDHSDYDQIKGHEKPQERSDLANSRINELEADKPGIEEMGRVADDLNMASQRINSSPGTSWTTRCESVGLTFRAANSYVVAMGMLSHTSQTEFNVGEEISGGVGHSARRVKEAAEALGTFCNLNFASKILDEAVFKQLGAKVQIFSKRVKSTLETFKNRESRLREVAEKPYGKF